MPQDTTTSVFFKPGLLWPNGNFGSYNYSGCTAYGLAEVELLGYKCGVLFFAFFFLITLMAFIRPPMFGRVYTLRTN